MTGQAICFTASEGLAYKCPLEAKSLASPQFIRSGMRTMAGAELARWRVAPAGGAFSASLSANGHRQFAFTV